MAYRPLDNLEDVDFDNSLRWFYGAIFIGMALGALGIGNIVINTAAVIIFAIGFYVVSLIKKVTWRYGNYLGLQFLSGRKQFQPKKQSSKRSGFIDEWIAAGNEIWNIASRGEFISDLAQTKEEKFKLKSDLGALLTIYENERQVAATCNDGPWIAWFNLVIEQIRKDQARLEREAGKIEAKTTGDSVGLEVFQGHYSITHQDRKAVSLEIRIEEEGEFEIYRRDGKGRNRLMSIVGGQQIRVELLPPAESGRIEIIRKGSTEVDMITLP